ncbi:MAG: hypothetical protein IKT78_04055, partial [Ruminiclostridium sp.]|nr:hypothetical protein [Ruminiclostridium sp.]
SAVIGIAVNIAAIAVASGEQALSADSFIAITAVSGLGIAIYIAEVIYSIVMFRKMPLLTEKTRKEISTYLIFCSLCFLLTEASSNLIKVYAFPEKSNIESSLTYLGFVAIALIAFVVFNLKYLKKRSYIFLDESYYEDELKKPAKKKRKKKKR